MTTRYAPLLALAGAMFCLALLTVLIWPRVPASPSSDAPDEVRRVLDDQVAAWNRGDLKGFMAGYWESPELTFYSGGSVQQGWQATMNRYREKYQKEGRDMGRLAFEDVIVQAIGTDSAFARGRYVLDIDKQEMTGLFTLVVKRLPEGWRIVHDHTSADPPPKPATP